MTSPAATVPALADVAEGSRATPVTPAATEEAHAADDGRRDARKDDVDTGRRLGDSRLRDVEDARHDRQHRAGAERRRERCDLYADR